MFYRLIKPSWGNKFIIKEKEKVPNPDFVQEVSGPNVVEGCFDDEYLMQQNKRGYNVYFFPNHPSGNVYSDEKKFLNGRDIDTFNYIFVDMDLKDGVYESKEAFLLELMKFEIKPTLVVNSGNGVHAYWNINSLTREEYLVGQKALIRRFNTDSSVWTVLQLMRLPNFDNTKKFEDRKLAEVLEDYSSGEIYEFSDFPTEMFELLTPEDTLKIETHINRLDGKIGIELKDDVNVDELPERFLEEMYDNEKLWELYTNPKAFYNDRSKADMKLANMLFSKNYPKMEALAILSNTQKALSKGSSRMDYAYLTVDKVYVDRCKFDIMTVSEKLKKGVKLISGDPVSGPIFFEQLHHKWRRKQVLGLIAGSGVGKTAVTLVMFKHMIENNPDNDDLFVFFSLEMPEEEIIERWLQLVGENSPLTDRLYVIGNEEADGEPRNLGLQEIVDYCNEIKKTTGKAIASVGIDHIGILNNVIDTKGKYTFGAEGAIEGGKGRMRVLTHKELCTKMKPLAKLLDTFLIVLTQTTKGKGQGDIPIEKDGAYGAAQYEWMMDYILTLWQPLMRVNKDIELRILAWQYAKIRNKHKEDAIQTYEYKLLKYNQDSGDLGWMNQEDIDIFKEWKPVADELRKKVESKETDCYMPQVDPKKLEALKSRIKSAKEEKQNVE